MVSTSLSAARQGGAVAGADLKVDMFSLSGFELMQRVARALASSDAVPAQFRARVLKKSRDGDVEVENPAAMGNCLVAMEVARSLGMSVVSVMQHANVIEGRLSWSAQFQIAAVNASGRFTPLRFRMHDHGPIKATYREKLGWNKAKGGFDFAEKTVEVDNIECRAWAFMRDPATGRVTDQVIEGPPVTMKMAVEEGWFSKPGSKWQGDMRELMLQYRAGAFFARIHAPDISMGLGKSSEELADVVEVQPGGAVVLTQEPVPQARGQVEQRQQRQPAPPPAAPSPTVAQPAAATEAADPPAPAFDADMAAVRLQECTDIDALHLMADDLREVQDEDTRQVLEGIYRRRVSELTSAAAARPATGANSSTAPRRRVTAE